MAGVPGRRRARSRRAAAALVAGALGLTGCAGGGAATSPSGAPSGAPAEAVTVRLVTTEWPQTLDPAGARTPGDALVATAAFQRLLRVDAATGLLKPDAADCHYSAPTVYECTLEPRLWFANRHGLGADDVVFSIERSRRLGGPETGAPLLAGLGSVETVDETTVRFTLRAPDPEFGYALAAPSASLVDAQTYPADALATGDPVGTGPFVAATRPGGRLELSPFGGFRERSDPTNQPGRPPRAVRLVRADAVAGASAGATPADATWAPSTDPGAASSPSAGVASVPLGRRVLRAVWAAESAVGREAATRAAVASALAVPGVALVPDGVPGRIVVPTPATAPAPGGGSAGVALRIGFDAGVPGLAAAAEGIRTRLAASGFAATLVPGEAGDLTLELGSSWTPTARGWLQRAWAHPGASEAVRRAAETAGSAEPGPARDDALAQLQRAVASDALVLPLAEIPVALTMRSGLEFADRAVQPGARFAPWGFTA